MFWPVIPLLRNISGPRPNLLADPLRYSFAVRELPPHSITLPPPRRLSAVFLFHSSLHLDLPSNCGRQNVDSSRNRIEPTYSALEWKEQQRRATHTHRDRLLYTRSSSAGMKPRQQRAPVNRKVRQEVWRLLLWSSNVQSVKTLNPELQCAARLWLQRHDEATGFSWLCAGIKHLHQFLGGKNLHLQTRTLLINRIQRLAVQCVPEEPQ